MKINYNSGIWFWGGAGVYSLINLILNYRQVTQKEVLFYNCLIFGVAIFGIILNVILLKRKESKKGS